MSNVPDRRLVNEAVATLLAGIGRPIGRSRVPTQPNNDQVPADVPFLIVYGITGGEYWGPPLWHPEDSMGLVYQVTGVGSREDQAQWISDLARQYMLGRDSTGHFEHPLTVAGFSVLMREPEGPPGGPTQESKIWQVVDRYKVTVSPL